MICSYAVYKGNGQASKTRTPPDVTRYLQRAGRPGFTSSATAPRTAISPTDPVRRQAVRELGDRPATLQITEEPNTRTRHGRRRLAQRPPGLGGRGARGQGRGDASRPADCSRIPATPSFSPSDDWPDLATRGGPTFAEASITSGWILPRRLPSDTRATSASRRGVLTPLPDRQSRHRRDPCGGADPRITENGWPTGPDRSPERQAEVLNTVVRTIHHLRGTLNITHYEFFSPVTRWKGPGSASSGWSTRITPSSLPLTPIGSWSPN